MIGTSVNTLLNAPVGSAWKAPGMGGYLAVVKKIEEAGTVGSVSAAVGDVLIAVQMRTVAGSGSGGDSTAVKPYLYLLKKATLTFVGGNQQTIKTVSDLLAGGAVDALSDSADANGPMLTPELLSFLLGPDAWAQSTAQTYETARTGGGDW